MNYKESQKTKVITSRDEIFRDPGDGLFRDKKRKFVLSKSELNLWAGIREDVMEYYKNNEITWWESGDKPSGHLLSSQIACLNHLYYLRQREDLATLVLKEVDSNIKKALVVDTGFVEFEKTGKIKLGKEKSLTRGANCTSIDALMLAEYVSGERKLVLIEWKYTESYSATSKLVGTSGKVRLDSYKDLLEKAGCPILHNNIDDLFYEPFYQLMRQTLLGWCMTNAKEYGATDWLHLHVIPKNNKALKNKITSPGLVGVDIEGAWKSVLTDPQKYIVKSPEELLSPSRSSQDTKSLLTYLQKRYW